MRGKSGHDRVIFPAIGAGRKLYFAVYGSVKRDAGGGKIPAASHTSVTGIKETLNKKTEKQKKNKRKKQNE